MNMSRPSCRRFRNFGNGDPLRSCSAGCKKRVTVGKTAGTTAVEADWCKTEKTGMGKGSGGGLGENNATLGGQGKCECVI